MKTEIEIRPFRESDLESFRDGVNSVCCEKWYVATVERFTLEEIRALLKKMAETSAPHVVAVEGSHIVGGCNIIPNTKTGFTHVGCLGMGVRKENRRQGIGRRLLEACLSLARESGLVHPALVEVHEETLMAKRFLNQRLHRDRSGVNLDPYFRLTTLGFGVCQFIEDFDISEQAD